MKFGLTGREDLATGPGAESALHHLACGLKLAKVSVARYGCSSCGAVGFLVPDPKEESFQAVKGNSYSPPPTEDPFAKKVQISQTQVKEQSSYSHKAKLLLSSLGLYDEYKELPGTGLKIALKQIKNNATEADLAALHPDLPTLIQGPNSPIKWSCSAEVSSGWCGVCLSEAVAVFSKYPGLIELYHKTGAPKKIESEYLLQDVVAPEEPGLQWFKPKPQGLAQPVAKVDYNKYYEMAIKSYQDSLKSDASSMIPPNLDGPIPYKAEEEASSEIIKQFFKKNSHYASSPVLEKLQAENPVIANSVMATFVNEWKMLAADYGLPPSYAPKWANYQAEKLGYSKLVSSFIT